MTWFRRRPTLAHRLVAVYLANIKCQRWPNGTKEDRWLWPMEK